MPNTKSVKLRLNNYLPQKQHQPDPVHRHCYCNVLLAVQTRDFIVDSLEDWWKDLPEEERAQLTQIQLKVDKGPESSGVRTQFLKRRVDFADQTGKMIHLLYYPPYHSQYNPIERCWGILEQHWNGTQRVDAETLLEWAKSMTCTRYPPGG